jgi:hypothetical protein
MARIRNYPSTVAFALLLVGVMHAQDPSAAARLTITESGGNYLVTIPLSQLTLTVPKAGFVPSRSPVGAAAANSNYFNLEDEDRVMYASGWFSPADGFSGIKEFWAAETASMKRSGLPEPRNVSFEQLGSWNAVFYDIEASGAASAHVRAHWVEAGTWIDLHLSRTAERPSGLRAELKTLLKLMTVSVTEFRCQR